MLPSIANYRGAGVLLLAVTMAVGVTMDQKVFTGTFGGRCSL